MRAISIVDTPAEMAAAFTAESIEYKDGAELLPRMKGRKASFYQAFLDALRLTLQNTIFDGKELRVVSCTKDASGRFFDSSERSAATDLPGDSDINAAWNIARKCHMVLRNIREYIPGKEKGPKMVITDEEWLNEVQK